MPQSGSILLDARVAAKNVAVVTDELLDRLVAEQPAGCSAVRS
ncbi:MAG TPA: hypothetical protein VKU60_06340 [Chloroflexota bacterium]|nr:hypothetical protein [Chloroflexota bacterium]